MEVTCCWAGVCLLIYMMVAEDMNKLARSLIIAFTVVFVIIVMAVLLYQLYHSEPAGDDEGGGSRSTDYFSTGMNAMLTILPAVLSATTSSVSTRPSSTKPVALPL